MARGALISKTLGLLALIQYLALSLLLAGAMEAHIPLPVVRGVLVGAQVMPVLVPVVVAIRLQHLRHKEITGEAIYQILVVGVVEAVRERLVAIKLAAAITRLEVLAALVQHHLCLEHLRPTLVVAVAVQELILPILVLVALVVQVVVERAAQALLELRAQQIQVVGVVQVATQQIPLAAPAAAASSF